MAKKKARKKKKVVRKKKVTRKKATRKKKAARKKKVVRKKRVTVGVKERSFTGRIGKTTWKIKLIIARDGRLVDYTATPTNAAAKKAAYPDFGVVVYLAEEHGILVF